MKRKSLAIIFLIVLLALSAYANPSADLQQGAWTVPVNLGRPINTKYDDLAAVLSTDGLTIYFTSNRPGSAGEDIWIAHRSSLSSPWKTPRNIGTVANSGAMERLRSVSDDGLTILFQSNRDGGQGGSDIWATVRSSVKDDLGWEAPVNLGPVINSAANEVAANYLFGEGLFSDELLFSSARAGGFGGPDLYESRILFGGGFDQAVNIAELNSEYNDTCMWLRGDGLEIIFSSTRAGQNNDPRSFDLWTSRRATVWSSWAPPTTLGPVINTNSLDVNPSVSTDGTTMTFTSEGHDGLGGSDIFLTTRKNRN